MAEYRIVCVDLRDPTEHRHVVGVGTGTDPVTVTRKWTVGEVRAAIRAGDRFRTVSPGTGGVAGVYQFDCSCGYETIRSTLDAVPDNDVDLLPECRWE